uniref:Anaphase-promoting complex subunit 4 WD40 domain-containing protein n=1 Tax=Grammatophora oceanica TaxID=210454 RepID=A0A7S1V9D2_9STRA
MKDDDGIDPLITLRTPESISLAKNRLHSVSSVCFLKKSTTTFSSSVDDDDSSDDSDDEEEPQEYRCSRIQKIHSTTTARRSVVSQGSIITASNDHRRFLASCHVSGDAYIWDLKQRRVVQRFGNEDEHCRGPGLSVQAFNNSNTQLLLLYQTRDANGTITIHDVERIMSSSKMSSAPSHTFQTGSRTYCQAAISSCDDNDNNLVVVPTSDEKHFALWDIRTSSTGKSTTIPFFPAAASSKTTTTTTTKKKHGMLTSLAMCKSSSTTGRLMVACGMESGSIFFHDIAGTSTTATRTASSSIQLSNDPILALDMIPSTYSGTNIVVSGMAGETTDLLDLPQEQRGTVGVVKVPTAYFSEEQQQHDDNHNNNVILSPPKLLSRVGTCHLEGPGKPGVNAVRFQRNNSNTTTTNNNKNGRLFAVAGWDRRIRIFDRNNNNKTNKRSKSTTEPRLLAILKGHADSVRCLDWARDAGASASEEGSSSSLLASGGSDGLIHIWNCSFLRKKKKLKEEVERLQVGTTKGGGR